MSRSRGPKLIREVLGKVLASSGYAQVTARAELEQLWRQAAGQCVYRRTRVGALRRGELEILVDNASLLGELEGFDKYSLLKKLQQSTRHNKIRSLCFRRM